MVIYWRVPHLSVYFINWIYWGYGLDSAYRRCWIPYYLNDFHKAITAVIYFTENLDLQKNDKYFFLQMLIGDEIWVFSYDPETIGEPKLWKSALKVLAMVYWDIGRILNLDILPSKSAITGTYYKYILRRLCEAPSR